MKMEISWWMNPIRTGGRIKATRPSWNPIVLDENGVQKVGTRNRKQWKRVLTDATGWNNPKNCELWRSDGNVVQLETENQQWQELTQKLNNENSLLQKQNSELLTLNSR